MKASIIIVTRNRCQSLAKTLASLRRLHVPIGLQAELVIVDNGSDDNTREVSEHFSHSSISRRYVVEPLAGQARGRNRGLVETNGDVILFLDDDVMVFSDWLYLMSKPMIHGEADAVAGGVCMANHLAREWMTPLHRAWLAETNWLDDVETIGLVGASMGFRRDVLTKVPGFDVHLGPGALGYGDDQLFALQLANSGYHIEKHLEIRAIHHFDKSRLTRRAWLKAAESRGRSQAYIGHHWWNWRCRLTALRSIRAESRLQAWRRKFLMSDAQEGCAESELLLAQECACLRGHQENCQEAMKYINHLYASA